MIKPLHWADQMASRVLAMRGDKDVYTCASGITPSGEIHIGNFREIITSELIVRALRKQLEGTNKKVRFIYSWDNYDVFRKVPKGMPKPEVLEKYLRQPIVDVPDVKGNESSYARHNEVMLESQMPKVGVYAEYLYQATKYRACEYAQGIKIALEQTEKIKKILNQFRSEPLGDDYSPFRIFDKDTNTDEVSNIKYEGDYIVSYTGSDGTTKKLDLRKDGIGKLQWRVDWPMRWAHEDVDFEPGGKDHSSPGSSYDSGKIIVKEVYGKEAPLYIMYDFVGIKGKGGKISSSSGNTITVADVLEIYEPEIVRFIFAGKRPGTEFDISFDLDVIKIYEDYDKCERMYYGVDEAKNEKEKINQQRIFELSAVDDTKIPKDIPTQVGFRHITTVIQIFEHDISRTVEFLAKENPNMSTERITTRATCASNWLKMYAPEDMVFEVNKEAPKIDVTQVASAITETIRLLEESEDPDFVGTSIYEFCKAQEIRIRDYFKTMYAILISKEKGPNLSHFMFAIGKDTVIELLKTYM